jgi:hypothetical protein
MTGRIVLCEHKYKPYYDANCVHHIVENVIADSFADNSQGLLQLIAFKPVSDDEDHHI